MHSPRTFRLDLDRDLLPSEPISIRRDAPPAIRVVPSTVDNGDANDIAIDTRGSWERQSGNLLFKRFPVDIDLHSSTAFDTEDGIRVELLPKIDASERVASCVTRLDPCATCIDMVWRILPSNKKPGLRSARSFS